MPETNPLHDANKLMPRRGPTSPNAPHNLPQGPSKPEPNSEFPNGWPTYKHLPKNNPNEA